MSYDLVVKNGTIVSASDTFVADLAIEKGRVVAVGQVSAPGKKVVDAKGKVVVPGGIDVHTHFDMPFMGATTADDFTSGSMGAVFGGTTCVVDFAIQKRGESLKAALDTWHGKAEGKSAVDY
ncbi:MAG: amidohydrolase family protein, partial [Elusimicrobia bacterium]|nr:amidohydrolase family protein [Elusimicrobiota bacterium]